MDWENQKVQAYVAGGFVVAALLGAGIGFNLGSANGYERGVDAATGRRVVGEGGGKGIGRPASLTDGEDQWVQGPGLPPSSEGDYELYTSGMLWYGQRWEEARVPGRFSLQPPKGAKLFCLGTPTIAEVGAALEKEGFEPATSAHALSYFEQWRDLVADRTIILMGEGWGATPDNRMYWPAIIDVDMPELDGRTQYRVLTAIAVGEPTDHLRPNECVLGIPHEPVVVPQP